jgi:gliding motility-associated-like protein
MLQFLLSQKSAVVRVTVLFFLFLAGLQPQVAQASHIRAGDIQAKIDTVTNNSRRRFFKMTLYTDNCQTCVDQPNAIIFFGDGTATCSPVPRASKRVLPGNPDTSVNTYFFEHSFSSAGRFVVSFIGENRNAGVLNMSSSASQSFYISTTIEIDPLIPNHGAVLRAPAVDKAGINQVFLHNPAGYDADGDSLAFKLRSCQQVATLAEDVVGAPCVGPGNNRPVPITCTNYRLPSDPTVVGATSQVPYGGVPSSTGAGAAIFVQDVYTGQITWNAPVAAGIYNVAMVVEEWRRPPIGRAFNIGEVIRDMQIIVTATSNLRPTITVPADICVVAGQRVTGTVQAVDNGANNQLTPISIAAYSGVLPPATFTQTQTGPPQATGVFTWRTDCSNVAQLPYTVVFKAQDSPTGPITVNPPLIDEKPWRITVVGPPPQNLRATPVAGTSGNPNSITLNWNTYQCANASQMHIYRKVGTSSFVPGPCDTGIPASAGYVRIGTVPIGTTTFNDTNVDASGTVRGLERGQTYCYRIYADFPFPAGGKSIASAEACAIISGRGAMLTKVDVATTQTNSGQIQVCWTRPRSTTGAGFDGTPSYVLSRAEGLNPDVSLFRQIATIPSLTDTCYTDTNLNTQTRQYTYKLDFVRTFPPGGGATATETAPPASSVRLSAVPDRTATTIALSWTNSVPWDNTAQPTTIYRRATGGNYVAIGTATSTATGGTYTDRDPALRKGENYCYYVQTNGRYASFSYLSSLLNRSQEQCLVLNTPPCTPVLALQVTNCDSLANLQEFPGLSERYTNRLRWSIGNTPAGCETAVANYRVYYRPTPSGAFTLLGTTSQTSFVHPNLAFSGGCYAIQAVATSGAVSDTSNVACQDNCVFFKLPNIFTPNGDGVNDQFRPKNNSPVRRIHFQAFNRWGVKVFENTTTADDPILINWNGGGPAGEFTNGNGGKVSDGVYYYLAEVEFADFANTKRTFKGWVEVVR